MNKWAGMLTCWNCGQKCGYWKTTNEIQLKA